MINIMVTIGDMFKVKVEVMATMWTLLTREKQLQASENVNVKEIEMNDNAQGSGLFTQGLE